MSPKVIPCDPSEIAGDLYKHRLPATNEIPGSCAFNASVLRAVSAEMRINAQQEFSVFHPVEMGTPLGKPAASVYVSNQNPKKLPARG